MYHCYYRERKVDILNQIRRKSEVSKGVSEQLYFLCLITNQSLTHSLLTQKLCKVNQILCFVGFIISLFTHLFFFFFETLFLLILFQLNIHIYILNLAKCINIIFFVVFFFLGAYVCINIILLCFFFSRI